jgi:amino acid transporter
MRNGGSPHDDDWGESVPAKLDPACTGLQSREYKPGSRPGGNYVRRTRSHNAQFRYVGDGLLQATPAADAPAHPAARFFSGVKHALIGTPLPTADAIHERLTKVKALAVLSSDALSSVAYGTEQTLTVLMAAGAAAFSASLPIAGAIVALLLIVGVSYRQTIAAYPKGGGSYIVSKDNLGTLPGLLAGASLLIGYVLTVAVSVSAGVDAITSARPGLGPYTVPMGVFFIAFITLINLRGIRESGNIFAVPTYLFLVVMFALIGAGLFKVLVIGVAPAPPAEPLQAVEGLSAFLILRAFAAGCSAMTGVEAISDGVPAFKEPQARNARTTLLCMVTILAVMFAGISWLAHALGIIPKGDETVLSQIARAIFGHGGMYYIIQVATAAILILAANTSFSDFPRLSYFLARDGYMPHQYAQRGERLAYSTGILTLGFLSGLLLAVFEGQTGALIALYAVGVFAAFTLSQASMVRRWLTRKEPGWQRSWIVNCIGAVTTGLVLVVVIVTRFLDGAWIVCLLIPLIILVMLTIHRHYSRVQVEVEGSLPLTPADIHHVIVVPVADLNRVAQQTLAYARSISDHVTAVHVAEDEAAAGEFDRKWQDWGGKVPLIIIEAPYRSVIGPLLSYVDTIDRSSQETVTVILPEYVGAHWWEHVLHNQTALRLKASLLFRPGIVVTSVPYHAKHVLGGQSSGRAALPPISAN